MKIREKILDLNGDREGKYIAIGTQQSDAFSKKENPRPAKIMAMTVESTAMTSEIFISTAEGGCQKKYEGDRQNTAISPIRRQDRAVIPFRNHGKEEILQTTA